MYIDQAFDIYEEFLRDMRAQNQDYYESAKCKEDGKERLLLDLDIGFTVELTNDKNVENSAALRCWWKDGEKINIHSIEQLLQAWSNSN